MEPTAISTSPTFEMRKSLATSLGTSLFQTTAISTV